jgi:hypothetical protein
VGVLAALDAVAALSRTATPAVVPALADKATAALVVVAVVVVVVVESLAPALMAVSLVTAAQEGRACFLTLMGLRDATQQAAPAPTRFHFPQVQFTEVARQAAVRESVLQVSRVL